ncbi:MAG: Phosphoribosylaminoimidazole-succinocarboxamide synthase (EC [uncultured Campylobacterales bacterium]|uniref:Phosphoribosylaminoimidazole-succinocarboxamide synthase n=1 Tax=uncultured Campylobacterales bacterium TaxID=352960 RepID=A0A6S6T516_9BACT|nr:MAG: Phosphoribosylaminoimidazole-succinocarboxamide synthase (EC [uncultured Campylobacterales bacterium]
MVDIKSNFNNTLDNPKFKNLGKQIDGKVRASYVQDGRRIIVTSDRISAFDVILTNVPFKGQILTGLSKFWFDKTKDIVPNHLIDIPDPSVMVVKECEVYPVEVVVRAYITGSAWRDYTKGNPISGITLAPGLKKNQKLIKHIITPSTKADIGLHDEPISREGIISRGLVSEDEYKQIEEYANKLFTVGAKIAEERGLILVDTKYEFGKDKDGNICVVDEIHTPDSSRYWYKSSYEEKFNAGDEPHQLDKEYLRGWLISQGFMGDGDVPNIPEEILENTVKRYITTYEEITGTKFVPNTEEPIKRIEKNLLSYKI